MPSLFENSIASIRMGVEDYRQQDADRNISAVRNLYAGVLLLAKEALIRKVPNADAREVVGAAFKPVPDGRGGVDHVVSGHRTIDFDTIDKRFKDFGLTIDRKVLTDLNEIRNDIEHNYTDKPEAAIRTAISKAFPVISSLFRQMDEDPIEHLPETWEAMLQERVLYEHELATARASLSTVKWNAAFLQESQLTCQECGSELLEQLHAENSSQNCVEFRCRNCGATPATEDVIQAAVENEYGAEAYVRAKDGAGDGPIYECPACAHETYLGEEDICANCGETLDYKNQCGRCGAGISIQDYLDGSDEGLCSYCAHVLDKVMRE